MKYYFGIILLLFVTGILANLIGIVSYNNVKKKIIYVTKFDNINKIITADKIYSYIENEEDEIEQRIYNFENNKYIVGSCTNFTCTNKCYDSIILNYFSLADIINTNKYNESISRELSLFFTGSWIGEMLIKKDNIIGCDMWKFEILYTNNQINNLINYQKLCMSS